MRSRNRDGAGFQVFVEILLFSPPSSITKSVQPRYKPWVPTKSGHKNDTTWVTATLQSTEPSCYASAPTYYNIVYYSTVLLPSNIVDYDLYKDKGFTNEAAL